jgi:molybdopterin converting factor small subunit
VKVRVKLSNLLRQATNWQEIVEVDAETPEECLRIVEAQFPDVRQWIYDKHGKMWDRLQLFVNGKVIGRDELSMPMQDGDELHVLLNIGGG